MHRQAIVLIAALLLTWSGVAAAAEIEKFNDGPLADAGYPFSESARVGDLLFLAGQIGTDDEGNLVAGGIAAEAEQTLVNIRAALARRGLSMKQVVKCTVFMADIGQWGEFNRVYKKHFAPPYPARSALGANGLALGAAVEVECIAGYSQ